MNKDENDVTHFSYDNDDVEVVIIENGEGDRDGYVELSAAADLLAPIVTMRGFNKAVLWTNVITSQRLTRNNKNYVHVFALCRHLSSVILNGSHNHHVQLIKRLIADLLIGAQSQIVDPLSDIKNQLCTLQECLTNNVSSTMNLPTENNLAIYQPTTTNYDTSPSWFESLKELLRCETANQTSILTQIAEQLRTLQLDVTNKLAFNNDTMLDNFKSLKDIVIRKK
ncbi:capsid protein P24 [Adoxophyes honmai nucleopolyhedrovirus]|uniref:Capsid protein P24 n=1 Tax=Adoxophyes honmai nucleopolyhedrovirus TaxID=224399 RepID=Q80LJ4_NPVAH|nr:capsid protein P24 [Adoxophyes honmai nucleopolyhedrovirus]BAC67353.1 capsid protein P24 [Adoxophyes honmai nucleopolyhedrovirus]